MKLMDILLQEKIEWPEGMVWCVQDDDGDIKFSSDKQFRPRCDDNDGIWHRGPFGGGETSVRGYPVSEDCRTSIITWEEYRNYNHSLAKEAYDNRFQQDNKEEEKDSSDKDLWFKKGMFPPTGISVELWFGGSFAYNCEFITRRGHHYVMWNLDADRPDAADCMNSEFRPLRTEREKAIDAACDVICKNGVHDFERGVITKLYDAGMLK